LIELFFFINLVLCHWGSIRYKGEADLRVYYSTNVAMSPAVGKPEARLINKGQGIFPGPRLYVKQFFLAGLGPTASASAGQLRISLSPRSVD